MSTYVRKALDPEGYELRYARLKAWRAKNPEKFKAQGRRGWIAYKKRRACQV